MMQQPLRKKYRREHKKAQIIRNIDTGHRCIYRYIKHINDIPKEEKNMFNKIKEKKGGFTLVELIIVLVILAILAAFLVPTLTGYVDRANEKALTSETRMVVMATQTIVDELYAVDGTATQEEVNGKVADIKNLAELPNAYITITMADNKITTIVYKEKEDATKACTYTASTGAYTFSL